MSLSRVIAAVVLLVVFLAIIAFAIINPGERVMIDLGWRAWPTLDWIKCRRTLPSAVIKAIQYAMENPDDFTAADIAQKLTRNGTGYHWVRSSESIVFLEKGKRALCYAWSNVLHGPPSARTEPPAKKPYNVIRKLIENSSEPDEWIFDPFAGSGIVGQAALDLHRKAILIDRSLDHITVRQQHAERTTIRTAHPQEIKAACHIEMI